MSLAMRSRRAASHLPVVAIIGAGASGTLTAVHLLRESARADVPMRVALIDRHGRHGLGQAYATANPAHLLNSPAGQMGALAGDPGHLLRWADDAGISNDGFLPRSVYGRYLRETLADAERRAGAQAEVSRITAQVVGITRRANGLPLNLRLAGGGTLAADLAVLATGNLPPVPPCPVPAGPWYIGDPWAPDALAGTADGRPVVILGTGLTMADLAIALTEGNPRTTVHAVSRHALLPRARREYSPGPACWLPALSGPDGPVRLADLMWQIRVATGASGGNWEDVIDSVRPHVPRLWRGLSAADKALFLRHVARYWEIHRHRMPPATARAVTALRATGRLSVLAGRVTAAEPDRDAIRVRVDQGTFSTELRAGWLINATGPAGDVMATSDPLLRDLLARGLVRPDPTRLGIDADSAGLVVDAAGNPGGDLFALGPLLRGLLYETTAIAEIRDQAAALACRIAALSRARAWPGSAS